MYYLESLGVVAVWVRFDLARHEKLSCRAGHLFGAGHELLLGADPLHQGVGRFN